MHYSFSILLGPPSLYSKKLANKLREGGCLDALLYTCDQGTCIDFCREARSFRDAVWTGLYDIATISEDIDKFLEKQNGHK